MTTSIVPGFGWTAERSEPTRRRTTRTPAQLGVVLLGALMLLWSAVINGRPAVFPDTALYYSEAEYLAGALGLAPTGALAGDPTALPLRAGAPNVSATIDGARSPVYAVFVYGMERIGGLWLAAALQAVLLALPLYLLMRAAAPEAGARAYLVWMALLASTTSLPFFASFIMPDVFAGAAAAAVLLVLVYWDRLSRRSRVAIAGLLAFSMSVHRSNLLIVAAAALMGPLLLATAGLPVRSMLQRLLVLAATAVAALAVSAAAFAPIAERAGEPVRDPPFLMARVLADGPGRSYLDFACRHGRGFALCRYRDQPREDSDTLLWSHRRAVGVFGVADYRTRLRLEAEEPAFVLGELAYAPLAQLQVSAQNVMRQLALTHVKSPLADPARYLADGYWRRTSLARIIPNARPCATWGACASRLSPGVLNAVQDTVLGAAWIAGGLGAILILLRPTSPARRSNPGADDATRILCTLVLVAGMVLANAVVCGALSAPVDRYQARLIWLVPAVTSLGLVALGRDVRALGRAPLLLELVLQRFPRLTRLGRAA